jgi:AcrR family transcriptional regulator
MLPLMTSDDVEASSSLRERNRLRVRAAIVDSALDLFSARGFDQVTVSDVAHLADVSPATVARYFPTKESMLFPERDVNVARLRSAVIARPRRESPWHALTSALTSQPPMSADARTRMLRSRQAIARSTVLRGRAFELLDAWREGIADALLERGRIERGDARAIATVAVALLDEAAARWAAAGGTTDLGDEVSATFAGFERGRRRTP